MLVAALGNPDRADDGVGLLVGHELARCLPADVTILEVGTDPVALTDRMGAYETLICVDSAAPMGVPGRIYRVEPGSGRLPPAALPASTHTMSLVEVLGLGQALGIAPDRITVYAIEGSHFDIGGGVGAAVLAAVPEVVNQIVAEVDRLALEGSLGSNQRPLPCECRSRKAVKGS